MQVGNPFDDPATARDHFNSRGDGAGSDDLWARGPEVSGHAFSRPDLTIHHAFLGIFIAGIMAGTAKGVSDEIRQSLSDTMHPVFVLLFFATLGLKIDFLDGLNLMMAVLFTAVEVGGKFVGAWLGGWMGGMSQGRAVFLGLIFIPGGAMEIVVATLAIELRLIRQTMFLAIVFAALLSSIAAGPLIRLPARRLGLIGTRKLSES